LRIAEVNDMPRLRPSYQPVAHDPNRKSSG
jgi:hypothetical protein